MTEPYQKPSDAELDIDEICLEKFLILASGPFGYQQKIRLQVNAGSMALDSIVHFKVIQICRRFTTLPKKITKESIENQCSKIETLENT